LTGGAFDGGLINEVERIAVCESEGVVEDGGDGGDVGGNRTLIGSIFACRMACLIRERIESSLAFRMQ